MAGILLSRLKSHVCSELDMSQHIGTFPTKLGTPKPKVDGF